MYIKKLQPGDRFGSRTIIEELEERKHGYVMYKVQCDCGKITSHISNYITSKERSCIQCGAKKFERSGERNPFYKHGGSARSKSGKRCNIYSIWVTMRQRCRDVNEPQYHDYGGRGIYVCQEWEDFERFKEDMGERPKGMWLDRINNDGPYCKENCKWSDIYEQANNRRNNRIHDIDGEKVKHTKLLKVIGYNRDKFRKMEENKKRGLEEAYNLYRQIKIA